MARSSLKVNGKAHVVDVDPNALFCTSCETTSL